MHIKSKLPTTLAICCSSLALSAFSTENVRLPASVSGAEKSLSPAPLAAISSTPNTAKQQSKPKKKKGYKLVWHDEFNGNRLDTTAWNIEDNGNGNGNQELQYYSARGVSFGREPETGAKCLILTARREKHGNHAFTSGRINTQGKVKVCHGIVEARIKFPKTANGLWPAFWLLGDNYRDCGWPRCGEIDILEMGNQDGIKQNSQATLFNGACHWGYYNDKGQYPNHYQAHDNAYSLQDGKFHTFTLCWDEKELKMFVDRDINKDAKPYFTMDIADKTNDLAAGNYFHHDFFIIFNLAVGGLFTSITAPGDISALSYKEEARMYVDWVRVYKKNK